MLIPILNLLLNPFSFILFLILSFSKEQKFYTSISTNTNRLHLMPYLVYSVLIAGSIALITYIASLVLPSDFTVWEVFRPRYLWLSAIGWGITIWTLLTYLKGMEGNIMGFIFFPMLALSCFALMVVNIAPLFSFSINLELPAFSFNFWIGFALHMFSPMYILLYINSEQGLEKENPEPLSPLISSLALQLFLYTAHWLVLVIFGIQLDFQTFFGAEQSWLYFLPMATGFVYFSLYYLSQYKVLKKDWLEGTVFYISAVVAFLGCLLQIFNYIKLMISVV